MASRGRSRRWEMLAQSLKQCVTEARISPLASRKPSTQSAQRRLRIPSPRRLTHSDRNHHPMSYAEKRRFIKDPVWGEVEFFSWERELLDHPLVNRLHGIVQTSCTFKVYPSLKYSRFAHSIGALHAVTQLFVNIARNLRVNSTCADDEVDMQRCRAGRDQFSAEAAIICERFSATGHVEHLEKMKDVLCCAFPVSRDDALALVVVRIGALLHDIGHLPYSHLLENTMEGFIGSSSNELLEPTKEIHKSLTKLATAFSERHPKLDKFHEWLGYQFATMLAHDPVLAPDETVRAFLRRAIELARDVWSREVARPLDEKGNGNSRGNFTPILSSLLSGDLDADRMDFVRRDSLFSGLFTCSVDFGRLFDLYEADENKAPDDGGKPIGWVARPSCRTASDAAKLLIERFQLYKYVVAHHRVHLFDELLERCLIELMRSGRLDQLLGDVRGVLQARPGRADNIADQADQVALRKNLLHLDDAWVDSQVRAWDVVITGKETLSTDDRCKALFGALLEKRGRFKSVFKWDRDFNAWWNPAFAEGPFDVRFRDWLSSVPGQSRDATSWPAFEESLRAEVLKLCRGRIIKGLFSRRYEFEKWLSEAAKIPAVIVGVTGRKVRGHMKSVDEAQFFGLMAANDYLTAATLETMVFNIWFVPGGGGEAEERATLLQKSLEWLADKLLPTEMFNSEANEAWKEVTT